MTSQHKSNIGDGKMVCWLPWLPLSEAVSVGPVRFLSYQPQVSIAGQELALGLQVDLDDLAQRFIDLHGNPVERMTIAVVEGKRTLPVLDENDLAMVRNATLLLMLGTLAKNRHFRHDPYANSYMFQLIVTSFVPGDSHVTVVGRRRDRAISDGGYLRSEVKDQAPRALHSCNGASFDPNFLSALSSLLQPSSCTVARRILNSLEWYRLANTDDFQSSPENECVLLQWAIGHLLDASDTNKNYQNGVKETVSEFTALAADASERPDDCPSFNPDRKTWPIVRQWAWEHYELRSKITHGSIWQTDQWRWKLWEHNLFAAWVYPLLVKLQLKNKGVYTLTDDDQTALASIDNLLAEPDWKKNWQRILVQRQSCRISNQNVEECFAKRGDEIQRKLNALPEDFDDIDDLDSLQNDHST